MEITAKMVQELRAKTGAGMMDCKKAITESGGDFGKAEEYLRKKGLAAAAKKAGRVASEGAVASYVHMGGKIGVLVEVNCGTDFAAKNGDFRTFVKDLAMQVAALNPQYLNRDEVPPGTLIHTGSMFGTIMAWNVWYRIWPAQRKIIRAVKDGSAPDGDLLKMAALRSRHNTYMSVPLLYTMVGQHTTFLSGGNWGIGESTWWIVFLAIIGLGWHVVIQLYKRSGRVEGF